MTLLLTQDSVHIKEVWKRNLEKEFELIREIVDDYPYIAMDTEFPGVVLHPLGDFKSTTDFNFSTLKANVDKLKLIQLGLTFFDEKGNLPTCGTGKYRVWQFNFKFNAKEDVHDPKSIDLLSHYEIDFEKNAKKGIDAYRFGELLMSSGIVLNDSLSWIAFHGGYDFGYLLKLLIGKNLPDTEAEFFNLLKMYFPTLYDLKHMMKFCDFSFQGGLNKVAGLLGVERIGKCHQAGSDSLLTCCAFMELKDMIFVGGTEKYAGVLIGLGVENGQIG